MNKNEKTKIDRSDSEGQFETVVICENLLCDRANEVDKNGNLYTEGALEKLDGIENLPVMLGFDSTKVIGKAKVNYLKGKGLLCAIEGVDRTLFEGKKIATMYKVDNLKK
jgi:hypothetical protein